MNQVLKIKVAPSENKPEDKRYANMANKAILPKLPTTCTILGRVGSGKTSCLYTMLNDFYVDDKGKSIFSEMVIYLGNKESDYSFNQLPCKNKVILHEFDPTHFSEYLEDLREHQLERLAKGKPLKHVCIVFDDFAATALTKKFNGKSPLVSLVLQSRHELHASVFFLSQVYKNSGFSEPAVRNNVMTWIIYQMSKPEWAKICQEHTNDFTENQLNEAYDKVMEKPHNFMVIDYRRPLDKRITEQFETIIRPN